MRLLRAVIAVVTMLCLTGCALDDASSARTTLAQWVWPEQVMYLNSTRRCTAAVFRLDVLGFRPGLRQARSAQAGLAPLRARETVAFVVPDLSPDQLSEAVISADLPAGLGLQSVAMAARPCMSDEVAIGVNTLLLQPGVNVVYAPSLRVLVLVNDSQRRAVFMRAPQG